MANATITVAMTIFLLPAIGLCVILGIYAVLGLMVKMTQYKKGRKW